MIFRNLDSNNDWIIGQGFGSYVSQNQAIGLNIKTRLQSWVGDCFFAQTAGIDWWNRLGSKNQLTLLSNDLQRVISQSSGVTGILAFNVSLVGRSVSASYTVQTIYSTSFTDSILLGA